MPDNNRSWFQDLFCVCLGAALGFALARTMLNADATIEIPRVYMAITVMAGGAGFALAHFVYGMKGRLGQIVASFLVVWMAFMYVKP